MGKIGREVDVDGNNSTPERRGSSLVMNENTGQRHAWRVEGFQQNKLEIYMTKIRVVSTDAWSK